MVKNQAYLRRKNKEDVVNLLRKKKTSYSELARALELSNTAIAKIADDLIADNIVRRESESKGRSGIELSLNSELGYVFVVDFSRWKIELAAFDFAGNLLLRDYFNGVNLAMSDIENLFAKLHGWQKNERLRVKPLLGISIATPGKIDKESGKFILNPRFKKLGKISLKKLFEDEFGCPVVVKNDIKLALRGEKIYGTQLQNINDALMLHIDIGTGAALMIGGKIYEGVNGFAGEIGYFKLNMLMTDSDDYHNMNYSNLFDNLSLYSALTVIKREVAGGNECVIGKWLDDAGLGWDDITIEMLQSAYIENDKLVRRVINSEAKVIGSFARCMAEFLDLEKILLIGSVVGFGEDYLSDINIDGSPYKIVFSDLKEDAPIYGAVDAVITEILKWRL